MSRASQKGAAPPCPCGLPNRYSDCCGRYHAGPEHLAAPTAEALMRSRYAAYALQLADYLLATWHPDTRPAALNLADDPTRWIGLEVKRTGSTNGPTGPAVPGATVEFVEFVARGKVGGRAFRLHETSRFTRNDGRWFYVNGDQHQ